MAALGDDQQVDIGLRMRGPASAGAVEPETAQITAQLIVEKRRVALDHSALALGELRCVQPMDGCLLHGLKDRPGTG